jgi:hypothetical protein
LVIHDQGAYGWCLSSTDGTRLATGMGPAQGMKPSSNRAEGYGMLSLLHFIICLFEFCGSAPCCSHLYSDNLALVNRIAQQRTKSTWYPNDTISSDWDILQVISTTLQIFPNCPTIAHVFEHQDKHTAYALLPLEAQLNVDADAAATTFQNDHGAAQPLVPRISGNGVQLLIDKQTVTHGYVTTLRNSYSYPCLHTYIGK